MSDQVRVRRQNAVLVSAVRDLDLFFSAVSICDVRDLVRLEHHVMLMERVGLRKSLLEALTRPHEVLFTTMSNDKHCSS